jgi:hypothetical protein
MSRTEYGNAAEMKCLEMGLSLHMSEPLLSYDLLAVFESIKKNLRDLVIIVEGGLFVQVFLQSRQKMN